MTEARRPFVHLNFAVDGYGRMSAGDGTSLPISSPRDWSRVHRLREAYQAVAVGGGTWIRDTPRLDVRVSRLGRTPRRQPDRVVFGGGRPCTFTADGRRTFVIGSRAPRAEGVVFSYCSGRQLARPLATLAGLGVGSLLVEGGPTLLGSFLAQGCFDRITVYVRTDDPVSARRAVKTALPGLPAMGVRPGAEGTLLSWPPESGVGAEDPGAATSPPAPHARLPTTLGEFSVRAYRDAVAGVDHLALALGHLAVGPPPLVRIHSECLTGDVLGSLRCDCGLQLRLALERIAAEGRGALLYLRQEGRGIGLFNKIRAYALQEQGLDTVEANERLGFAADLRDYSFAARMLADLGAGAVRLMTNNPMKLGELERHGVRVAERVPLTVPTCADNELYLRTKRDKLRHLLQ